MTLPDIQRILHDHNHQGCLNEAINLLEQGKYTEAAESAYEHRVDRTPAGCGANMRGFGPPTDLDMALISLRELGQQP